MAAIERGEGASDTVVKSWLAKALTVSRGPQWVCDNCHHIHAEWAPVCENCESFDTLSWTTPATSEVATPTGVQMLPLIVGALDDPATEEDPEPNESDTPLELVEQVVEDAEVEIMEPEKGR